VELARVEPGGAGRYLGEVAGGDDVEEGLEGVGVDLGYGGEGKSPADRMRGVYVITAWKC